MLEELKKKLLQDHEYKKASREQEEAEKRKNEAEALKQ